MLKLLRRLQYLLGQRQAHADLDEELEFHRAMTRAELQATGADEREIPVLARRRLGNASLSHDQVHDVWVPSLLQGLGQDFRVAVRTLAATPVVSAVCLLSLALGIGANTAIFSVTNGVLLRPLAVERPDRLALVVDDANEIHPNWEYRVWEEIERRPDLFASTAAWSDMRFNLAPSGETAYVNGIRVSGSFFQTLGVPPLLGRTLTPADDVRGGGPDGPVAVISYGFWQQHFAGARSAIGAPVTVDRVSFTVVGVLPRTFHGLDVGRDFEIAVPIRAGTARDGAASPLVRIVGRLHPGGTMATATAALRAVQPQIRAATLPQGWPDAFLERYLRSPFTAVPATHTSLLRHQFVRPLLAIMVVVSLVLLVACANLANLGGARAAARRRELGLRRALGASRLRLIRQLTAESVILAAASAAFGLLIAKWSAELLVQQLSRRVGSSGPAASTGGVFVDVALDARVLAFTVAVTVCTIVIVGILPALGASRVAPMDALLEGRGEGSRRRRAVLGHAFLALQVAISVVVAVAAGLFGRTLISLETRPLGFETNGVLVTTIEAGAVPPAGRQTLYEDLLERVRREPGVTLAALSSVPPVTNGPTIGQPIQAVSGEAPLPPRGANIGLNLISPGWFDTLGIPLLEGRDVSTGDRAGALPVVLVNQMFVRTFIHGGSPVGRTVSLFLPGTPPPPVEIIGVVADTVYGGLRDKIEPTMYLPIAQLGPIWVRFLTPMTLSVRTPVSPVEQLSKPVARAVASANGDLSMTFHALQDYVNDSLVQERLLARLAIAFALLAVLLAALGLYGVAAFAVAGRRSEIGIRIALGASPSAVVRLVLGLMFRPVTIGLVSGIVVSLWLSRLIDSLLYDVTTRDPATFVMAAGVLSAVALVASWLPARRAARIEPASIVRCT